jgi:hypothetical protein
VSTIPARYTYRPAGDAINAAVIVPARVARLLDRYVLDRVRVDVRGDDAEVDAVLDAIHGLGLRYFEESSSDVGTAELVGVPTGAESPGESVGTAAVAALIGTTTRNVVARARSGALQGWQESGPGSPWRFRLEDVITYLDHRNEHEERT